MIYFISGNKNKFAEVKAIIPDVQNLEVDLPEIQEMDPHQIIEYKLREARRQHPGELFCEDTSLYITCLKGLPGPLIKWFLHSLGNEGIYDLVRPYADHSAVAKTVIGYTNGKETKFFEGEIKGMIVSPKGRSTFGWDPLFQPDGYEITFAEMSREEKNRISMRRMALKQLDAYLHSHR